MFEASLLKCCLKIDFAYSCMFSTAEAILFLDGHVVSERITYYLMKIEPISCKRAKPVTTTEPTSDESSEISCEHGFHSVNSQSIFIHHPAAALTGWLSKVEVH